MIVYVAVVEDRHADPDPQVFTDREAAIAWALKEATESARGGPEDVEVLNLPQYYEFYVSYSPESDCAWVVKRELDDPANMPRVKPESPKE